MARIQAALTTISLVFSSKSSKLVVQSFTCITTKRNVHLHGRVSLQTQYSSNKKTRNHDSASPRSSTIGNSSTHSFGERPMDPVMLTSSEYLDECVDKVSSCALIFLFIKFNKPLHLLNLL